MTIQHEQVKAASPFGTGYPPGRSPLAIEKRAAAPWITLRDPVSGRPACHTNKKRWPTVARIQFQITYTNTLVRWYQSDQDPERRLPILSAYLGHVHVEDTQWYLNGSPELMREAMRRLEHCWRDRP
jgi:hypothetical protein